MSSRPSSEAETGEGSAEGERSRILLVAYHFPPSAAVGGLRAARFARFLPAFGWEPFVLTVQDADREQDEGLDRSRLAGLESVPITRTRAPSGLIALYGRLKLRMRGVRTEPPAAAGGPVSADAAAGPGETWAQKLKRYVVSLCVLLPDAQKNWAIFAVVPAIRMIRRHRIDYVLTSGPPFSVHLVGLVASAFTRARWVADFRDPWIEMLPERSPHGRSRLSDRLEMRMEASVMRGADFVLTTTERMRQSMVARYPDRPAGKFVCLPNGIDRGAVAPAPIQKYGPLTITYAGTLYLDRSPEPLFQAFGALVREGRVRLSDFRIKLVGSCRHIGDVETLEVARTYGVEESVEIIDRVPHAEAIEIMRRSHLLLVLAPANHELVLPAKIFDYLGSGSKILALAEAGATADLMLETGGGACFPQHDLAALREYLQGLLADGRYRELRNEPGSFARYDARSLTGELVAHLHHGLPQSDSVTVRT